MKSVNELVIKLDTNIEKIQSDIDDIKSQLKLINTNIIENSADLKYLKKDIYGNGKRGLIQRMEYIENLTKDDEIYKNKITSNEKNIESISRKVDYATGICAVISFIIVTLKDFIKFN